MVTGATVNDMAQGPTPRDAPRPHIGRLRQAWSASPGGLGRAIRPELTAQGHEA